MLRRIHFNCARTRFASPVNEHEGQGGMQNYKEQIWKIGVLKIIVHLFPCLYNTDQN